MKISKLNNTCTDNERLNIVATKGLMTEILHKAMNKRINWIQKGKISKKHEIAFFKNNKRNRKELQKITKQYKNAGYNIDIISFHNSR